MQDLAFGRFEQVLRNKARFSAAHKVVVSCTEPFTSKTCSKCGYMTPVGGSKSFVCKNTGCNYRADRDQNAAAQIATLAVASAKAAFLAHMEAPEKNPAPGKKVRKSDKRGCFSKAGVLEAARRQAGRVGEVASCARACADEAGVAAATAPGAQEAAAAARAAAEKAAACAARAQAVAEDTAPEVSFW